jgi:hypothetical protein
MIYILIVLWFGSGSGYTAGKAALAVEFNTKENCLAAADEIKRQASAAGNSREAAVFCAAKGYPK